MPAPHHSVFYRPDAFPAAQPTASKHWRLYRDRKTHRKLVLCKLALTYRDRPIQKSRVSNSVQFTWHKVPSNRPDQTTLLAKRIQSSHHELHMTLQQPVQAHEQVEGNQHTYLVVYTIKQNTTVIHNNIDIKALYLLSAYIRRREQQLAMCICCN